MRKYISLLILICSLNIYAAELPPAPQPEALQTAIRNFIDTHVDKNKMYLMRMAYGWRQLNTYSEIQRIPFSCDTKDPDIMAVLNAFVIDEHNSYQYVHEVPGSGMLYSVSLDRKSSRREITRKSKKEEFYMLCVKNYDNPRYRDMYAISYVKKKEGKKEIYEGTLFHVYSPRPDFKDDEPLETPQYKEFRMVGYLDDELADSCKSVVLRGADAKGGIDYGSRRESVQRGHFVFSKQLGKPMDIQIAYQYKNGGQSNWQTIKAVPGMTLNVDFHKDSHKIKRVETDYNYTNYADDVYSDDKADKQKMTKADETLNNYSVMLKAVNDQIRELRSVPEDAPDHSEVKKRLSELHKTARDITKKMQDLVEKMEKELE